MKEILTEWRKYLAEEQDVNLKEQSVIEAAKNFKDLLLLSANATGKLTGTNLQPLDQLADSLRTTLINSFKGVGLSSEKAAEFTAAVESAIAGSQEIVEMATKVRPTGFQRWLRMAISTLAASRPYLTRLIRLLGQASAPLMIIGAIFDIIEIATAWNDLAKTAGKTKNMRAFEHLREIEKEIEDGQFVKPKTATQNNTLMNKLTKALQVNPNALDFFPTVVEQLSPYYQDLIKKTAEYYKTNS